MTSNGTETTTSTDTIPTVDLKVKVTNCTTEDRIKDLDAEPVGRRSFSGKAKVMTMLDGAKVLKSYDTIVAVIRNGSLKVRDYYSHTTSSHVKAFALTYLPNFDKADLKHYDQDDPVFNEPVVIVDENLNNNIVTSY